MKPESTVIAVIGKKARSETRVTIATVAGKPVIHARIWYRPRHFKDGQPMIPTRRGIAFAPEKATPVAKALLKAAGLCLYNTGAHSQGNPKARGLHAFPRCLWCKAEFLPRTRRGKNAQRFCDSKCKDAWHYAERCRASAAA